MKLTSWQLLCALHCCPSALRVWSRVFVDQNQYVPTALKHLMVTTLQYIKWLFESNVKLLLNGDKACELRLRWIETRQRIKNQARLHDCVLASFTNLCNLVGNRSAWGQLSKFSIIYLPKNSRDTSRTSRVNDCVPARRWINWLQQFQLLAKRWSRAMHAWRYGLASLPPFIIIVHLGFSLPEAIQKAVIDIWR